ncbi:hypothetical protein [Bacillus sp. FJAT-28004]|uniref:hypothetical protein n=1 Tax=Bacillus sp. FJAT-28004 TaxID=1679165 RepID=UPI0006B458FA|nr:hypothetical protein [Bacillus sp. FJAT-28004]
MRTYEDYYKEEAQGLAVGSSKGLLDQHADKLTLLVKLPKAHVIELRDDIRASAAASSVMQIEQRGDLIAFTVSGADKTLEKEAVFIIPFRDETIKNLQRVASGGGGIEAVMVSEDYSEVYGLEIFKESLAKVTLQKKIDYILSLQNA